MDAPRDAAGTALAGRVGLTCLRLRPTVSGKTVRDFDDYLDFEARDLTPYGPVSGPGFELKLFVSVSEPRVPAWAELFSEPFQVTAVPPGESVAAILVLRLVGKRRYFAFTFGVGGRYLLKDDAWERAYGLRTALNLIYPRGDLASSGARLVGVDAKRRVGET